MSRPLLRVGDDGEHVQELQKILYAQGYWTGLTTPSVYTEELEAALEYFQSTHLGPAGGQLEADGIVGGKTWWALENPDGDAQRSFYEVGDIPLGIGLERVKLLQTAVLDHGVRERPNGSNRGPAVDRFLPRWWVSKHGPRDKGPAWCAFYVGNRLYTVLGEHPYGGHYGSTHKVWAKAEALGMTRALPTPGDIFMLLNPGGTGHTGFVYWVSPDGEHYYTIEGNCGNRVKVGKRSIHASNHKGFINPYEDSPDYSLVQTGDLKVKALGSQSTR